MNYLLFRLALGHESCCCHTKVVIMALERAHKPFGDITVVNMWPRLLFGATTPPTGGKEC